MTAPSEIVLVEGGESLSPRQHAEMVALDAIDQFRASWSRTLDDGLILGDAFIRLKAVLPRGEWLPWLNEHFDRAEDLAQRLMQLASNTAFVRQLPAGTGVTEAVKALQASRRSPKQTPIENGYTTGDDVEAPGGPLLRYMLPGVETHVIVNLIMLTCFPDARTVLDVTYGMGNFWSGSSPYAVTGCDLDESRVPEDGYVLDFTDMSSVDDASYDVVVFDPPHLADGGEDSVMAGRFSTVTTQAALETLTMNGAREAWRVCRIGILVKIADQVHGQMFQDMAMTVCDAIATWPYEKVHQVRTHSMHVPDGEQYSALNNGATYLMFRKGSDQRHRARRRDA